MGLIYRAFLPPTKASDVVTRLIKYTVDGVDNILEVGVNDTYFDLTPVKDNANCVVSIKDIDDSGNESDWSSSVAYVAKDTIVPGTPEGLSVKLNREVPDDPEPVPTPAPQPDPVVVPEPDTAVVPEPNEELDDTDTLPDVEDTSNTDL